MSHKLTAELDLDAIAAKRAADDVNQKLRGIEQQSGKTGEAMQSGIGKGTAELGRFALGLAGVGSAAAAVMMVIGQLKAEYQNLVQRQREAASAQILASEARSLAISQLPGGMQATVNKLVTDIAPKTTVQLKEIWGIAGAMGSKVGQLPSPVVAGVLEQTIRMRQAAGSGFNAPEYAIGLLDLIQAAGLNDAKAAAGLGEAVVSQTGVTGIEAQMSHIKPILNVGREMGFDTRSSLAMYATGVKLGGGGRASMEVGPAFFETLQEMRTKEGAKKYGIKRLTGRGWDAVSQLQDQYARMTPEQQEIFKSKLSTSIGRSGMVGLITGAPSAMQTLGGIYENIPEPSEAGAAADQQIKAMGGGPYDKARGISEFLDSETEQARLKDPQAYAAVIRDKLRPYLRDVGGFSDLAIKMATADFEIGSNFGKGDVEGAFLKQIKAARQRFGYGMKYKLETGGMGVGPSFQRFISDLPEGTEKARRGERWVTETVLEYRLNSNYDPGRAASLNRAATFITNIQTNYGATPRDNATNNETRMDQ